MSTRRFARLWPDVATRSGRACAERLGMWAALAFAAMAFLGAASLAYTLWRYGLWALQVDLFGHTIWVYLGWAVSDGCIASIAAMRFAHRKGMVAGSIAIILFLTALSHLIIQHNLWSPFAPTYPLILLGLIHGVRGAWSGWRYGLPDPAALHQVFE